MAAIDQIEISLFVIFDLQKWMRVKKFPMILALHLKRFKYVEQYNRHIKVSHRVVFPFELRLYDTVSVASNILSRKEVEKIVCYLE
jgi:ubiquitin C-terminal hydrolase